MEQVATVEQAEPQQGSAAPGQDTSTAAPGDGGEATQPSFGTLFRQHVEQRAASRAGRRAPVSSAGRETSAADEQPASDAPPAGVPDTDGAGHETSATTEQQKLSRSQRKALKQASPGEQSPATVDTSASEPDPDPVARVERTMTERLDKLETLLRPQQPPSETDQAYAQAYDAAFGSDAEYARRAELALADRNQLTVEQEDELSRWATNRKTAELNDLKWKRNLSAVALSAADRHGLDPQTIVAAATPDAIFDAFARHGEAKASTGSDAKVAEVTARADKLEAANRLLTDEIEALRERLPASARHLISGGISAVPSPDGPPIDRERANGRQLMAAGLGRRARQANGTSRGAAGIVRGAGR